MKFEVCKINSVRPARDSGHYTELLETLLKLNSDECILIDRSDRNRYVYALWRKLKDKNLPLRVMSILTKDKTKVALRLVPKEVAP